MYIDIHILQTVPPSCVNRDDTGSPKTAYFGGVRRARVSSQAWKRAARTAYADQFTDIQRGVRTKRVHQLIVEEMQRQHSQVSFEDALAWSWSVLTALELKPEEKDKKKANKEADEDVKSPFNTTKYLLFLSRRQIERLAALAFSAQGTVSKKQAAEAADHEHGVDVALFGRMVADAADINVDAAVQVAHALSTHAVEPDQDYFTAVDDENPDDQTGAGMIGTVEFNSATLYRYATINVDGLLANLGDTEVCARLVAAFTEAFVMSMPTGKQNTFANRTIPDAVVVMVRGDQPTNLVGAFENPVLPDNGYVGVSAERLKAEISETSNFLPEADRAWLVRSEAAAKLDGAGQRVTLPKLVTELGDYVRTALGVE